MAVRQYLILAALVAPFAFTSLGAADHGGTHEVCSPYPVGWCGTQDRMVVFACFVTVGGLLRYATDYEAITVGTTDVATDAAEEELPEDAQVPGGIPDPESAQPIEVLKGRAYLRPDAADGFIADPWESDLPSQSVWEESNGVPGLQPTPFRCGKFQWWAECKAWMGPFDGDKQDRSPDSYVI